VKLDVADLNRVRRSVQAAWDHPGERPKPMIQLADEEGDRDQIGETFKTIASEMGIRYIRLDLAAGLTPDHEESLARAARNPRLILITSIDGVPADERPTLHDRLCGGAARTIPIVVCFLPADVIERTLEAQARLKEIDAERERRRALYREHGIELED
jgi:hypothetical protein